MKTKLIFTWVALALLLTACEEEEGSYTRVIHPDDPFTVNVYAGMPGVYGYADDSNDKLTHPVADVAVKIYSTKEDYLRDRNVLTEGLTDSEGKFSFEYDSLGSLWFATYKDTLSNQRGISRYSNDSTIDHNQIIITGWKSDAYENYHGVFATLTNAPTGLQLSVSHRGLPVEGAEVQLYFTEQTYRDSLAAQKDFKRLRPTYGYPDYENYEASKAEEGFIYYKYENFLQTTNKEGVVIFDNLEPRNYWFRITKDTLSNEETTIRTLRALPRESITTTMAVGIE